MQNSILSSTIKVTIAMFAIKALGFVKQIILAAVYGTTAQMDAYFIATSVLTALGTIIFSSISISLLSMYTEKSVYDGKNAASSLVSDVLKIFLPFAAIVSFLFFVGSPLIAKLLAPTYEGEQMALLSHYIKVMAPSFLFVCYQLILNTVLESHKHFLPGKCLTLFQNLFVIILALVFSNASNIDSLVYAFLAAGIVQCVLVTFCSKSYFTFKWRFSPENKKQIKKLFFLSLPLLVGNAVYEVNDIVGKQIASGLYAGGVSVLSYGASLNEIVTTVLIGSVSTVLFSHFATWAAEKNIDKINGCLKSSSAILIVLVLPLSVICALCGQDIVALVYGRGSFTDAAVTATKGVLIGYAVGFVFQALRSNFSKVFYAFKDTRTPMINGIISVVINIALSFLFSTFMDSAGIALATSLAMAITTVLLYIKLKKHIEGFSFSGIWGEIFKALIASAAVGGVIVLLQALLSLPTILMLLLEVAVALLLYILLMAAMRSKTLKDLVSYLPKRRKA